MAKRRKATAAKSTEKDEPLVDISADEQWRIINQSGILHKITDDKPEEANPEELLSPFTLELFAALALIIPFSFCLLLMEILVHYQYGRKPTLDELMDRMIPGVPIIAIFIFYTNRYKQERWMQLGLFVLAIASGGRLLWMLNHANWRVNMQQLPPLATAWIYGIAQLNLGHAVASLFIVGAWVWYKDLHLSFY